MKTISKSALLASLVACAAFAQEVPVATEVKGLVTVGQGSNVGLLQPGTPIVDGTRIVTGSSGSATIQVSPNCLVPVGPSQAFTFVAGKSCSDLVAAIVNIGSSNSTQFAGLFSNNTALLAAVGAPLTGVTARMNQLASRSAPISGQ
jgi:hypothetical protein